MLARLGKTFARSNQLPQSIYIKFQQKLQYQQQSVVNMNRESSMESHIVWVDLEMTGLNPRTDKIIEVACIITDKNLNEQSESLSFAINYPKSVFENMNDWCMKVHYETGLVQKCLESDITPERAESILLEYLEKNVPRKKCPLAGNTVYMDKMFLELNMPSVTEYLHYRIIDVSTVKELCKRWNNNLSENVPQKKFIHRGLDDIKESIEELKFYRQHFFSTTKEETNVAAM